MVRVTVFTLEIQYEDLINSYSKSITSFSQCHKVCPKIHELVCGKLYQEGLTKQCRSGMSLHVRCSRPVHSQLARQTFFCHKNVALQQKSEFTNVLLVELFSVLSFLDTLVDKRWKCGIVAMTYHKCQQEQKNYTQNEQTD